MEKGTNKGKLLTQTKNAVIVADYSYFFVFAQLPSHECLIKKNIALLMVPV